VIVRIAQARGRAAALKALLEERERTLLILTKEAEELRAESNLTTLTETALQQLSAKMLEQSTGTIENLVTAGLQQVFHDQSLQFRIRTDRFRGKTAVRFELLDNGRLFPINNSYGGGVLCIIGVLLRITTISILGMRRVLFLDESLAHLATRYHANATELLKNLSNKLGFTITIITHAETLVEGADRHYEARRQGGEIQFHLLRG
jgi:DNA repair exonuclease SbcCD ATPase subunit